LAAHLTWDHFQYQGMRRRAPLACLPKLDNGVAQSHVRISMRIVIAVAIAAVMVLSAHAGFAEPQAAGAASTPAATGTAANDVATPPAAAHPAKPKHGDPDEVVCKTTNVTGSRLGGARTCLKRKEWQATARDAQDTVDATTRNQINPQQ
jgi:hypothetical protein